MKLKLLFPALCALMISLVGCKKDEPQEPKDPATQEENNQKEDDKKQNGPKLNVYEIETGAAGGVYKIQLTSTSMWSALPDKNWVTVDPEMGNGNAIVNVRVQAGTETDTAKINFVNDEGERILLVYREKSEIQEPTVSPTYVAAPISVSATKKVFFSPGNLQYRASTKTWRFAENQYDVIGEDNANISSTYDGWIDLFGWGTGNNPTYYGGYIAFVDWGTNKIGSDAANTWRTLRSEEWYYLFTNRENASELYASATVNDQAGIIVLPDNTKMSITFNAGMVGYAQNTYSVTEWDMYFEKVGALFLPAASFREGTLMDSNYSLGYYWSSTLNDDDKGTVYMLNFSSTNLDPRNGNAEFYRGYAVRLVQDVK